MMTGSDLVMRGHDFPDTNEDEEHVGIDASEKKPTTPHEENKDENPLGFLNNVLEEIVEKAIEKVDTLTKVKLRRPRLQRSFSCDYESILITCDVIDCECDNNKHPRALVQAVNLNCSYMKLDDVKLRRNSVQFSDSADEENKRTQRRNSVQFMEEEILIDPSDHDEEEEEEVTNENSSDEFVDAEESVDINRTRRDSLYSLQEEDLDENDNLTKTTKKENEKDEKKKGGFMKSFFSLKKQKSIDEDNNILSQNHKKNKKYSSASDISTGKPLKRSSSFLKRKLNNFLTNETGFLKRSLSFRSLTDKREEEKSREKLSEMKNQLWAQSLQSLVENDHSVSYKDMSFVNYDALDKYDYTEEDVTRTNNNNNKGKIWRSQSMLVNGSFEARSSPKLQRGTSLAGDAFVVTDRIDRIDHLTVDIAEQSAVSLPSLHHLNQENADVSPESSPGHRYQRRPQSIGSEDGRLRPGSNGSFRSAGSGCAKLKRNNACRQKSRTVGSLPLKPFQDVSVTRGEETVFNIVRLFAAKNLKIAREATVEEADVSEQQEWRRLVGSLRRRVQRHASSGGGENQPAAVAPLAAPVVSVSRKNSLTQTGRFDFFRREKSREEPDGGKVEKKEASSSRGIVKQKSTEPKVKVVKSGTKSEEKPPRLGSLRVPKSTKKEEKSSSRDDFLQATMRIFLVVSPPVGKMQVRSRSLNHLDTLDMRQGVPTPSDTALKDARSEPDCTKPLLAPTVNAPPCDTVSPTRPTPPQRRHVLSRSQKSSSECFSVNFEVGDEAIYDTELFFPATRGVTLYESLSKQCELRNIDLPNCDAWLLDKEGNSQTWLPLTQDTACLVGKHVRISNRDGSASASASRTKLGTISLVGPQHTRKFSGVVVETPSPMEMSSTDNPFTFQNFRPKTGGFFSSSTEDATSLSANWPQDAKAGGDFDYKKQTKQRWSGLFGNNKDAKLLMEQLIEQLGNYSKYGVPGSPSYPIGHSESTDALYKLEDDWRDIINSSELTEKQQKQQTALWELIKTEVAYIKTLKVVTDLFLACLVDLQSSNILKEIDRGKLFSNISDILDANVQFWKNSLYPLVRDMRAYKQPACIETMCEGFLKMEDGFQAYYRFCGEQARCQHYCRENLTHNHIFTAYLAWCETQKECNRLRLMDILVQPMQRLTKYGLLLKAILRNTDDEVECDNLCLMIRSVDDFVNNVNSSLKQKQDNERLKGIIARIESYDIVETKDDDLEKLVRSYNQLDLNKPMLNCPPERKRHLLLEGDLKFKDSNTSKIEIHCFLLTDMLLICKPTTKKGGATVRVIRQPYLVDKLVITEVNKETPTLACVYKNEYDMAVAAFTLQNTDSKKLKSWKHGIAKAQKLFAQAKQSFLPEESFDTESNFGFPCSFENEFHCLQAPRSPLASSSRASRVSSLAHSHSGSVEMNDQSSVGSVKEGSRAVSVENDNRTASISSDEGVQPLPPDKSPVSQKNSFKNRLFHKTPNTLSVQPYTHGLGQSLPNLALGSPNMGTLSLNLPQNTLSVPSTSKNGHLLSPTHRGISYPPPSPTRGNLRRGLAITQNKNPPLIKTRHVTSASASTAGPMPASFDFDVPVIAGVSSADQCENFSRGQHRQAMLKRIYRNDNKRYHTAGVVDDIKKNTSKDASIMKRLSWNCSSQEPQSKLEDQNLG